MAIFKALQEMESQVVHHRRSLHQIPEPGFEEYATSEYICKTLDELNITYEKNIGKTGIVACIKGQGSQKTLAFRADMDALSLDEQNDIDFKSKRPGFMHGCGHDGHMTMLLVFAEYLMNNLQDLKVDVVLIFQPAEEGPGGAEVMLEAGIVDRYNIDEFYGIHLHPEFDQGTLAISAGPVMAMTGEFDIDVLSASGHGAMPHTANDATQIGCQMISQFQTIISRNTNPTQAGVLTVGKLYAGERRNIIADHMRLEGTIRAFDETTFYLIQKRMADICKGLETSFSCEIRLDQRTMYPPVINHKSSVDLFKAANQTMTVVDFPPQMISEDFSYFLKARPGAFVFLGTRNPDMDFVYPLHNSKFNFDEGALLFGIQSYINLLNHLGSDFK